MKERAILLLFCATVLLFSLACGAESVVPTPTPTKTPMPAPASTSTPTSGFPQLVLKYLEYNEEEQVATIRVQFGSAIGTYQLKKGEEALLGAIGCEACKIAGIRVWLRLNPVTNRLEYRREGDPEWRVLVQYEPLQL